MRGLSICATQFRRLRALVVDAIRLIVVDRTKYRVLHGDNYSFQNLAGEVADVVSEPVALDGEKPARHNPGSPRETRLGLRSVAQVR